MNYNRAVLFGSLAGLVGAAAWAGIAYFANYEIGYLAWGIGFAVGAATVMGAGYGSQSVGIVAVVITILSIVLGKYASVELVMNDLDFNPEQAVAEEIANLNDDALTSYLANDIATAREEAGEELAWPEYDEENESIAAQYPTDVWSAASEKFGAFTEEEKLAHRTHVEASIQQSLADLQVLEETIRQESFLQSFSAMDLLFFGLAIYTAFSVGQSNEFDGDKNEEAEAVA